MNNAILTMKNAGLQDDLGFGNVWNQLDKNVNYLPLFKQRLKDQFIQRWNTSLHTSPKLDYNRKFKTIF